MKIKEVIVVEGLSDKRFLETFLEADFLITNGSAIDGFDKDFLQEMARSRGVIILTDPDAPGERIRKQLASYLPVCKHAFVRKENAIAHHKVGVAEATKEEILFALQHVVTLSNEYQANLSMKDLYDCHLIGSDSSENKEKIVRHFHIGHCNGKTLLNRLNMLNVKKEQLEEVLSDDQF